MQPVDLSRLRNLSVSTLEKLVTDDGIYASSAMGMEGLYHGFFGRDTAITAYLISQTEHMGKNSQFLYKAVGGLVQLMKWQSKEDNPHTGEEHGKFPHEIRLNENDYKHLTSDLTAKGWKSWYVDPNDKVLKNWDTADATQLWIIVISRMYEKNMVEMNSEMRSALKYGLMWTLRNIRDFQGFAGFAYDAERPWAGCMNQTWKDSELAYMYEDGRKALPNLKDVFVNALSWCALRYGAKVFETFDHDFAHLLTTEAAALKQRFNELDRGFLMQDKKSGFYYAEALDHENNQLKGISCDPAMALWAYCDGETIIDSQYIPHVVKRIMSTDMFDSEAGIRTYSCEGKAYDPILYHRGPHTYWPFVSALIADGLNHFGYGYETKQLLTAMVKGVQKFDSCIELFVKNNDNYERFKNPLADQVSCTDQAWTAAAVYYATQYLGQEAI